MPITPSLPRAGQRKDWLWYRAGLMKEPPVNGHDRDAPWQELARKCGGIGGQPLRAHGQGKKTIVRGVYDHTGEETTEVQSARA